MTIHWLVLWDFVTLVYAGFGLLFALTVAVVDRPHPERAWAYAAHLLYVVATWPWLVSIPEQ